MKDTATVYNAIHNTRRDVEKRQRMGRPFDGDDLLLETALDAITGMELLEQQRDHYRRALRDVLHQVKSGDDPAWLFATIRSIVEAALRVAPRTVRAP